MNHAYKLMVASVAPLFYTIRQELANLLQMHEQMVIIDLSFALLLLSIAVVMWFMCLNRMMEMSYKMILLMLTFYAAMLSTHLVIVAAQLLAEQHPDWHAAAAASVLYYFNGTLAELSKSGFPFKAVN